MSNNNVEFAANEITKATDAGGLSSGYTTLMDESKGMSKLDQTALTKDLVAKGTLPELSFAYLDADMKSNGLTSIDKQGVTDLKTTADNSGNPLQAAMADTVAGHFDAAAETRRVPAGRFGEMKTAIFADTLDDKIQASASSGMPPETDTTAKPQASSDASVTPGAAPITEQVKTGDSYWSVAERALGLGAKPLDKQQDHETFDLMKTLASDNGNAMLQPGDTITVQASDLPQSAASTSLPAANDGASSKPAAADQPAPASQPTESGHLAVGEWVPSNDQAPAVAYDNAQKPAAPAGIDYTAVGPAVPVGAGDSAKGPLSWL
jgi:hypothetical protein